jgi:hypothetical protein
MTIRSQVNKSNENYYAISDDPGIVSGDKLTSKHTKTCILFYNDGWLWPQIFIKEKVT